MQGSNDIYKLMPLIMRDIGAIEKHDTNNHQKYKYRSIEDTLAACQPVFIKHGVTIIPAVEGCTFGERGLSGTYKLTFVAPDGSSITASTFIAGEPAGKGFQVSGAAYSYAFKEIIFKTFSVPVEQEDGDRLEPAPKGKAKADKPAFVEIARAELEESSLAALRAEIVRAQKGGAGAGYIAMVTEIGKAKAEKEGAAK